MNVIERLLVLARTERESLQFASKARALLEAGYYVNIGLPPATPSGESLLRCAISAAHTEAQMDGLAEALIRLGHEFGVLAEPRLMAKA